MRPLAFNSALLGARPLKAARLDAGRYERNTIYPTAATVTFTIASSGTATIVGDDTTSWTWLVLGTLSDFVLDVVVTDGSLTSGTTGTGLSLSSGQVYRVTRTSGGDKTCTATFRIKDATSGLIYAEAEITLYAAVEL